MRAWAVKDTKDDYIFAKSVSSDKLASMAWALDESKERRRIGLPMANYIVVPVEITEVEDTNDA